MLSTETPRAATAKGAHAFRDAASVPQNTCTAGSSFGVSGATGSTPALGRTSGAMRSSCVSSAAVVSRSATSASFPTSSASSATWWRRQARPCIALYASLSTGAESLHAGTCMLTALGMRHALAMHCACDKGQSRHSWSLPASA